MERLDGFPIQLSLKETLARLKIDGHRAEKLQADEIFKIAVPLIHPRALYASAPVTRRTGGTVSVGGADFTSRILAKNLDGRETVFPYILTIGEALEKEARATKSVASQFLLDELGNTAIESSINHLQSCISQQYGLKIISHMSPGQLDWSISQQRELFSILGNVENAIGVRLTDSLLMVPRKSVSGFMFPTAVPFISCQLCQRPGCTSRKAPYNEDASRRYTTESVQGC
jgi:hypothetical protein